MSAHEGDRDEARRWYDTAKQSIESNQKHDDERIRLQAEAQRLVMLVSE